MSSKWGRQRDILLAVNDKEDVTVEAPLQNETARKQRESGKTIDRDEASSISASQLRQALRSRTLVSVLRKGVVCGGFELGEVPPVEIERYGMGQRHPSTLGE